MDQNGWGILLSLGFVTLVLGLSTWLSKSGRLGQEGSRKLIHIGVSNWWLIAMHTFTGASWALVVPALFVVVNLLSWRKGLISAMERTEGENSLGTVWYPVSLCLLVIWYFGIYEMPWMGALGVLCMGWGDGLAALVGMRWGKPVKWLRGKSLAGCGCMFLVSFVIAYLLLIRYAPEQALLHSVLVALAATVIEACSGNGLDNLTVPLLTPLFYQFILYR